VTACVGVSVWEATGENKDPGWVDCMSKLLGSVCPVSGGIYSVHVYVLLWARKLVLAAGVRLWGQGTSVPRCQQLGRPGIHSQLLDRLCV